jgi:hypothetical protein
MDIKKTFTDTTLEQEGVWLDYRDGSRVKLARAGNPRFSRQYASVTKKLAHNADPEVETRALCGVMGDTIVLGWESFTDSGEEFPYSPEAAAGLLWDSIDFRNDMVDMSTNMENFRRKVVEEAAKNSKRG